MCAIPAHTLCIDGLLLLHALHVKVPGAEIRRVKIANADQIVLMGLAEKS